MFYGALSVHLGAFLLLRASPLMERSAVLAVAVIMVLFATGTTELPLWLNLVAILAPVGFGLGLVAVFNEARGSRRTSALRNSGRPDPASQAGVR